jgi:hypothetical protein
MIELLLATTRMLIVLTSMLTVIVFLIGAGRVWHESRALKSLVQYAWEHADKLASTGVMIGFLLLIYRQPYVPAGYELSILINIMFVLKSVFELRGVVVGYARNFWTSRGTVRKPVPEATLQTQF